MDRSLAIRVATYNIRYDRIPDSITVQESLANLSDPLQQPNYLRFEGEQPWSKRRLPVAEQILSKGAMVAGFQEALLRQVKDLAELLGHEWSWIGVGREDGHAAGEFSPIFFKRNLLKLITSDTFWLSYQPFEPSKYLDTYLCRVCTVGRFAFTSQPDLTFTLLNTHMDHASDPARRLGASLLLWRARYEAVQTKSPVFVTGDLNSSSNGEDSGAYKILTGTASPEAIPLSFKSKYPIQPEELPDFKLVDMRGQTPRRNVSGNFATFTGFNSPADTSEWSRIDFIFGGSNGGWTGERYSVVSGLSDDGILASDHRPVFAEILASSQ